MTTTVIFPFIKQYSYLGFFLTLSVPNDGYALHENMFENETTSE